MNRVLTNGFIDGDEIDGTDEILEIVLNVDVDEIL